MEYALGFGLTLLVTLGILYIRHKKDKKLSRIVYSQSNIHEIIRPFLPPDVFKKPKRQTQSSKHTESYTIRVIMLDEQAYWVYNNTFYMAETVNGHVNPETTRPVDTNNLTNKEIDKMLFILDSLNQGKNHDSGSAGDERIR